MSTTRKTESNRRNAIRYGLTTMSVTILPGEKTADLEALKRSITAEWNPISDHESFLVDQMITARWRLIRLGRLEAEAFDCMLEQNEANDSPDRKLLVQLETRGSIFEKLERYTRAAERAYSKAVRDLQQHRAARAKTTKQNKAKEANEWLRGELAKLEQRNTYTDDPTIAIPVHWSPPGENAVR
jgi:hypothetical protein